MERPKSGCFEGFCHIQDPAGCDQGRHQNRQKSRNGTLHSRARRPYQGEELLWPRSASSEGLALAAAADFDRSVFINCPFDKQFEPIMQAMLFCIVYLGLKPRIARERNDA